MFLLPLFIVKKCIHHLIIGIFLLITFIPKNAHASTMEREIPSGFTEIVSDVGVTLFRKNYSGGSPDYVQVVDFSQGASLVLLHGDIDKKRPGKGMFGGDDPKLTSKPLERYWKSFNSDGQNAFCVTNGQFFYMPEYPTRLPFSLKVDGKIISDGYGYDQHVGDQLILEIWEDQLDIKELTRESLYSSTAPDIVAGLTEDAKKQKKRYTGRTFVGIDDFDQDGIYETLMIYNSKTARQIDASNVLYDFGADKVMMLDGGGSTQLICNGKSYVTSERLIPQAIGVLASSSEPEEILSNGIHEEVDLSIESSVIEDTQPSLDSRGWSYLPIVGSAVNQAEKETAAPIEKSNITLVKSNNEDNDHAPLYSSSGLVDILIIPLTMSPVLAILIVVINRTRYQLDYTDH